MKVNKNKITKIQLDELVKVFKKKNYDFKYEELNDKFNIFFDLSEVKEDCTKRLNRMATIDLDCGVFRLWIYPQVFETIKDIHRFEREVKQIRILMATVAEILNIDCYNGEVKIKI